MRSDEELMADYVGGDRQAFRDLFERFAPQLQRMLRRYVLDADDARDLIQQTFLQAHRARLDFKPGSKVRPWLLTIAFNLGRDHVRRRARKRESELPEEPVSPADSPEAEAQTVQKRAAVNLALAKLSPGQREAVTLHWFEGLSFGEIAEITGAKVSAVKVRAHRAYGELRTLLGDVTDP